MASSQRWLRQIVGLPRVRIMAEASVPSNLKLPEVSKTPSSAKIAPRKSVFVESPPFRTITSMDDVAAAVDVHGPCATGLGTFHPSELLIGFVFDGYSM